MEKKKRKPSEKPKLYLKTGNRVKLILEREKKTLSELQALLPGDGSDGLMALSTLSQCKNGYDKLTEETAQKIIDAFPDKGYRLSWLLGYDDDEPTEQERRERMKHEHLISEIDSAEDEDVLLKACMALMKLHGATFSERKHNVSIRFPSLDVSVLPAPSAVYDGCELDADEVIMIINRTYNMMKMELDCAVRAKHGLSSLSDILEK